MKVPFIDLHREYSIIKPEILKSLEATLDSQHFILGENVKLFEKECANYLNAKHAISVASGTDALLLSLMALNIKH